MYALLPLRAVRAIARRHRRGVAMLEYALILIFMSTMIIIVTHVVLDLLPDYYRSLLASLISATV